MNQLGKITAVLLVAIGLVACKGTENSVTVTVDGHGVISDGTLTCADECETIQPLNWLQSQLLIKKSVSFTPVADFGYEFFGWTKYNSPDANNCLDNDQCTLTVWALCDELLDFRMSGIPCGELAPMHRSTTAVFVEQGSVAERVWSFGRACLISSADEVHCWGHSDLEDNPPQVINPSEIQLSGDVACIMDDIGLHCWGDEYYLGDNQPLLISPTAFTVGSGYVCAIDLGQVVCWGYRSDLVANMPILNNPTRITSVYPNVCVIDDAGLHCFGVDADVPQSAPIGDEMVVSLPNFDCTITDDIFECERFIIRRE